MKKTLIILSVLLAAVACAPKDAQTLSVVPYPNEVTFKTGEFCVAGAPVRYEAANDDYSKALFNSFAEQLTLVTGVESAVYEGKAGNGFSFVLDAEVPHEAYTIAVTKKGVTVKASGISGFNYAVQTLKQMLPAEVYGKVAAADKNWNLPCVKINDAPRFKYRGLHMDVSRHFFDKAEVMRYLDVMAVHKLNTLHWHLTDDQGWRLEIKKYPLLTEVGSIRKETIVGHLFENNVYDGKPYGEGCWYSQEDVKEIIEYAASKGITVIPEIDLPGHMLAALAAYPQYGCTGGPYDVWGRWGIADDVLCVGREETMLFLEDILAEVCDLFPAEYIHIGGDECPKVRWETCPHCQAKIKELGLEDDDRFQAEHYLQGYVTSRMEKFLAEKGKKLIGWDEILEGELAPNATVMSWRGVSGGIQAARMGHDAIMTPNTYFYLDYYQSLDQENEPLAIGGYLPVEKCYSYEPLIASMTDEEKAHIIGVQANLWTEYIPTADQLYYMLLPRLAALAEVQWCQPETKSWERFYESADEFCGIYYILGYNYGNHIFDTRGELKVNREKGCVEVILDAQGETPIRYTLDGSEPCEDSPLYTEPIEVRENCTIKARSQRGQMSGRTYTKTFTAHKAMGRPIETLTATHPNYTFSCPDLLTDGIVSEGPYNSGDVAGWYNQPFEAVVDMDGATYSEVTLCTIVFKHDWIMNAKDFTVYTSEDGNEFIEVAHMDITSPDNINDGNGCINHTLTFDETSAKYLKVTAGCITELPSWHPGAGHPGFLFVGEVVVK